MRKYRGYYIDGVVFKSEKEIDDFHRESAVGAYKTAVELFASHPSMERSNYVHERAVMLVEIYGYTWDQVEELEIEVYEAIA